VTVFEVSQVAIVGTCLMAIFLTVRHTRADEEAGRTELLRAGVLGRNADLAAIGLVMAAASTAIGTGLFLTFVGVGLPVGGSLVYGAAIAVLGAVFAAITLVVAQVTSHSRSATGLALAVLGVLYGLRAIGDVNGSWLTWTTPIGWIQAVRPFAGERWWPLGLGLALAGVLVVLGSWLTTKRDIGSGLVAERPGPARASRALATPLALAFRLQRGALLGWMVGLAALGAVYGSFGQDVADMVNENPELAEYFSAVSGGATITDAFFGIILLFNAVIASGFTVSSALRMRNEEHELRAEPVLATPVSRRGWALSSFTVTVVGSVLVLASAGVACGLTWALISDDPGQVASLTAGQLSYLPATLLLGGLAFALYGWLPRGTGAAYAALVACFVIGWLGDLLKLPDWAVDLSPFNRTPMVPVVDYDLDPLAAILAIAATLAAAGVLGLQRRDLQTG
jgi:ABC-2 type transport system permease protein